MHKVLVVEDSPDIYSVIAAALAPLQLHLVSASSVLEAVNQISSHIFDFVILDLGLPDGDGLSVLNCIRQNNQQQNTPVFILSSKADISSKVSAFSIGADDYITKPFDILELRARVESKLRRFSLDEGTDDYIYAGPLTLEMNKLTVLIKDSHVTIHLSPIEFRLLALFARRPGNIFSRCQILDQIWGSDVHVTDRTIDTHVYTLRKKLGEYGELIKSVQGEGYRFVETYPSRK